MLIPWGQEEAVCGVAPLKPTAKLQHTQSLHITSGQFLSNLSMLIKLGTSSEDSFL